MIKSKFIKIVAALLTIALLAQDVVWADPDGFNLAVQSMFSPITSRHIRDIGIIRSYVSWLARSFPDFKTIPGDVSTVIGNERIKVFLSFSERETFKKTLANIILQNDEYIIPCRINRTKYYAYITPGRDAAALRLTVFTQKEFEEVKRSGIAAHLDRTEREEGRIAHEAEYDTPLTAIRDGKAEIESVSDDARASAIEFFRAFGASPELMGQIEVFLNELGTVSLVPRENEIIVTIDGEPHTIPITIDKAHASDRYINIPKDTYDDIAKVLIHELSAKCGNPHDEFNVRLETIYDEWLASGGKINLTENYPDVAKAITAMRFKDLRRVAKRDYSEKDKQPPAVAEEIWRSEITASVIDGLSKDILKEIVLIAIRENNPKRCADILGPLICKDREIAPLVAKIVAETCIEVEEKTGKKCYRFILDLSSVLSVKYGLFSYHLGGTSFKNMICKYHDQYYLSKLSEEDLAVIDIADIGREVMHDIAHLMGEISVFLPRLKRNDKLYSSLAAINLKRYMVEKTFEDRVVRIDGYTGFISRKAAKKSIRQKVAHLNGQLKYWCRMRDKLASAPKGDANSQEILKLSELTIKIAENFIKLAKTSAKQKKITEELDINKEISVILDILSMPRKIIHNRQFGVELPKVRGESYLLSQLFMNLIDNARGAIKEEGSITVKTWTDGESVFASIADTGSGIPKENIQSIFEPYFTTKIGGTGLGLSACRRIVESLGGEITVKSCHISEYPDNHGTTFTIRLPASYSEHAYAGEKQVTEEASQDGAQARRLLGWLPHIYGLYKEFGRRALTHLIREYLNILFASIVHHGKLPPLWQRSISVYEEARRSGKSRLDAYREEVQATYNWKVKGLLFWPNINFKRGKPLDSSLIAVSRNSSEVRDLLVRARDEGVDLSIIGHLRGVDGCGSSLDLPEFQKRLTRRGARLLEEFPSTPTIASDFGVRIRFELCDNPDVIEYIAPDYGITSDNPYKVKGSVQLDSRGKTTQKNAPAFILRNIFGLSGIRVVCEEISPMAMAGGMESSNVFNVALIAAASMLSGADLSLADIFNLAVKLENDEFNGLTGGQGHLCSMTANAYQHIWFSGAKNFFGMRTNPYSTFSIPLFDDEEKIKLAEDHMLLVQAGKEYIDGEPKTNRAASLTNWMWTDLLRDNDPVGRALHEEKLLCTAKYTQAIQKGDYDTVVKELSRYVEIRDELTRRWLALMLDARKGVTGLPMYAYNYERKVFDKRNHNYGGYEFVRALWSKHGDDLRNISLYSLDPIASLISAAKAENIAIMPLGAGGPGTNMIAVSAKGTGHIKEFLHRRDIHELNEDEARRIIRGTGTLKGYLPFKAGKEPIMMDGFEKLDLKLPAGPEECEYDEYTGKFNTPQFEKKEALKRFLLISALIAVAVIAMWVALDWPSNLYDSLNAWKYPLGRFNLRVGETLSSGIASALFGAFIDRFSVLKMDHPAPEYKPKLRFLCFLGLRFATLGVAQYFASIFFIDTAFPKALSWAYYPRFIVSSDFGILLASFLAIYFNGWWARKGIIAKYGPNSDKLKDYTTESQQTKVEEGILVRLPLVFIAHHIGQDLVPEIYRIPVIVGLGAIFQVIVSLTSNTSKKFKFPMRSFIATNAMAPPTIYIGALIMRHFSHNFGEPRLGVFITSIITAALIAGWKLWKGRVDKKTGNTSPTKVETVPDRSMEKTPHVSSGAAAEAPQGEGVRVGKYLADKSLTERGRIEVALKIAYLIKENHDKEIFHGNISRQSNILVRGDGTVSISGFGDTHSRSDSDAGTEKGSAGILKDMRGFGFILSRNFVRAEDGRWIGKSEKIYRIAGKCMFYEYHDLGEVVAELERVLAEIIEEDKRAAEKNPSPDPLKAYVEKGFAGKTPWQLMRQVPQDIPLFISEEHVTTHAVVLRAIEEGIMQRGKACVVNIDQHEDAIGIIGHILTSLALGVNGFREDPDSSNWLRALMKGKLINNYVWINGKKNNTSSIASLTADVEDLVISIDIDYFDRLDRARAEEEIKNLLEFIRSNRSRVKIVTIAKSLHLCQHIDPTKIIDKLCALLGAKLVPDDPALSSFEYLIGCGLATFAVVDASPASSAAELPAAATEKKDTMNLSVGKVPKDKVPPVGGMSYGSKEEQESAFRAPMGLAAEMMRVAAAPQELALSRTHLMTAADIDALTALPAEQKTPEQALAVIRRLDFENIGANSKELVTAVTRYLKSIPDEMSFLPNEYTKPETNRWEKIAHIHLYVAEILRYPLLTRLGEIKFATLCRFGDDEARETLITSNLRLVVNIARRYLRIKGTEIMDLIEDGNEGLIIAVNGNVNIEDGARFDPSKGNKFSTYATSIIKGKIRRALSSNHRQIRIPEYQLAIMRQFEKLCKEAGLDLYNEKISSSQISDAIGWPIEKVKVVKKLFYKILSLDQDSEGAKKPDNLGEHIEVSDTGYERILGRLDQERLVGEIERRVRRRWANRERKQSRLLDVLHRRILPMGNGERKATQKEIASEHSVTRPQIRFDEAELLEIARASAKALKISLPGNGTPAAVAKPLTYIPGIRWIYEKLGHESYALTAAPFIESLFIVLPHIFGIGLGPTIAGIAMAIFTLLHFWNIDWKEFESAPPREKLKAIFKTLLAPIILSAITFAISYQDLDSGNIISRNIISHFIINLVAIGTREKWFRAGAIAVTEEELTTSRVEEMNGDKPDLERYRDKVIVILDDKDFITHAYADILKEHFPNIKTGRSVDEGLKMIAALQGEGIKSRDIMVITDYQFMGNETAISLINALRHPEDGNRFEGEILVVSGSIITRNEIEGYDPATKDITDSEKKAHGLEYLEKNGEGDFERKLLSKIREMFENPVELSRISDRVLRDKEGDERELLQGILFLEGGINDFEAYMGVSASRLKTVIMAKRGRIGHDASQEICGMIDALTSDIEFGKIDRAIPFERRIHDYKSVLHIASARVIPKIVKRISAVSDQEDADIADACRSLQEAVSLSAKYNNFLYRLLHLIKRIDSVVPLDSLIEEAIVRYQHDHEGKTDNVFDPNLGVAAGFENLKSSRGHVKRGILEEGIGEWGILLNDYKRIKNEFNGKLAEILNKRQLASLDDFSKGMTAVFGSFLMTLGSEKVAGVEDGNVVGRIRIIRGDEDTVLSGVQGLGPDDIAVLEDDYSTLAAAGECGGIIFSRQGAQHIRTRARALGVPLLAIPGAVDILEGFENEWIVMESRAGRGTIRPATATEVSCRKNFEHSDIIARPLEVNLESPLAINPEEDKTKLSLEDAVACAGQKAGRQYFVRTSGKVEVPAFSALTYRFFKELLAANPGTEDEIRNIFSRIDNANMASVRRGLSNIQDCLRRLTIPDDLKRMIVNNIPHAEKLIIRLSTNAEDLDEYPGVGAGIYGSFENIPADDPKKIIAAILEAYASMWSFDAYSDRVKFGIDHFSVHAAVMVQEYITDMEYSILIHTMDPVTKDPSFMMIEFMPGGPRSLTSPDKDYGGEPFRFYYRRQTYGNEEYPSSCDQYYPKLQYHPVETTKRCFHDPVNDRKQVLDKRSYRDMLRGVELYNNIQVAATSALQLQKMFNSHQDIEGVLRPTEIPGVYSFVCVQSRKQHGTDTLPKMSKEEMGKEYEKRKIEVADRVHRLAADIGGERLQNAEFYKDPSGDMDKDGLLPSCSPIWGRMDIDVKRDVEEWYTKVDTFLTVLFDESSSLADLRGGVLRRLFYYVRGKHIPVRHYLSHLYESNPEMFFRVFPYAVFNMHGESEDAKDAWKDWQDDLVEDFLYKSYFTTGDPVSGLDKETIANLIVMLIESEHDFVSIFDIDKRRDYAEILALLPPEVREIIEKKYPVNLDIKPAPKGLEPPHGGMAYRSEKEMTRILRAGMEWTREQAAEAMRANAADVRERWKTKISGRTFLFELREKDGIIDIDAISGGVRSGIIEDNKFVYGGDDAMSIIISVLGQKKFDIRTPEGIVCRKKIDWWSSLFSRHSPESLRLKKRETNSYLGTMDFTLADPASKKDLFFVKFERNRRHDIVNCSYGMENIFRHTGLVYHVAMKVLLNDPDYRDICIMEFNTVIFDEMTARQMNADGNVRFLRKDDYYTYLALLRPYSQYAEEALSDGRVAVAFRNESGQLYMQIRKGKEAKAVIEKNRVTYNANAEDIETLRRMKIFNMDEEGKRLFRQLEIGTTEDEYVRYLREELDHIMETERDCNRFPEHFLDICERFGLDPADVMDPVLSKHFPFTPEEEEVSIREIEDTQVEHYRRKDQAPNIDKQKRYYTRLIDGIFKRRYPAFGGTRIIYPIDLEYMFHIKKVSEYKDIARKMLDGKSDEIQEYLDGVIPTTTAFARKPYLFRFFRSVILPDIMRTRPAGSTIRLLSAGCSYGCEPYSLAIEMLEKRDTWAGMKIEIVATDVNRIALEKARKGIFNKHDVENLSPDILKKYFIYDKRSVIYQIKSEVQQMVEFFESDILDPDERKHLGEFDYIMAMQIFEKYGGIRSNDAQRSILIDMLKPGGYVAGLDKEITRDFENRVQSYEVCGTHETGYASLCARADRERLYDSSWEVIQKISPDSVRYEHYPGDPADILVGDKLQDAINVVYMTQDVEDEARLAKEFKKAIAPFPAESVEALSFYDVRIYVILYNDGKNPRLEMEENGRLNVVCDSGEESKYENRRMQIPDSLQRVKWSTVADEKQTIEKKKKSGSSVKNPILTFFEILYGMTDNPDCKKGNAVSFETLRSIANAERADKRLSSRMAQDDLDKLVMAGLARKNGTGASAMYVSAIEDEAAIQAIHMRLFGLRRDVTLQDVLKIARTGAATKEEGKIDLSFRRASKGQEPPVGGMQYNSKDEEAEALRAQIVRVEGQAAEAMRAATTTGAERAAEGPIVRWNLEKQFAYGAIKIPDDIKPALENLLLDNSNQFLKDTLEGALGEEVDLRDMDNMTISIVQKGYFNYILRAELSFYSGEKAEFAIVMAKGTDNNQTTRNDYENLNYLRRKYPKFAYLLQEPYTIGEGRMRSGGGVVAFSAKWIEDFWELKVTLPPHEDIAYAEDEEVRVVENSHFMFNDSRADDATWSIKSEKGQKTLEGLIKLLTVFYDDIEKEAVHPDSIVINKGDFMVRPDNPSDIRLITVRELKKDVSVPDFLKALVYHREPLPSLFICLEEIGLVSPTHRTLIRGVTKGLIEKHGLEAGTEKAREWFSSCADNLGIKAWEEVIDEVRTGRRDMPKDHKKWSREVNEILAKANPAVKSLAEAIFNLALNYQDGEKVLLALDEKLGKEGTVNLIRKLIGEICDIKKRKELEEILQSLIIISSRGKTLAGEVNSYIQRGDVKASNVIMVTNATNDKYCRAFKDEAIITYVDDSDPRLDSMGYYPFVEIALFTFAKALCRKGVELYDEERLISLYKSLNIEQVAADQIIPIVIGNKTITIKLKPSKPFNYDELQYIYRNLIEALKAA